MSFAQVLAPAIELAERGYPLSESYARSMGSEQLLKYPSSARLYAPGGKKWKEGEIFKNTDFARTLRRLVEAEKDAKGREAGLKLARDRFYKGDIAREMAEFSEKNGGLLRYEDFANYTVKVEEPVSVSYRGYEVYKNPSATQGPAELFMLNLLGGYDLKLMGHNSANFIHTSVEATKLAMADRDKYLGDMDFVRIPYEGLLSKQYAEERRKLISAEKASFEFRPGQPEKYMSGFAPLDPPRDIDIAGRRRPRRRHQLHCGRGPGTQCHHLYAKPAQRFWNESGDGGTGIRAELPWRLFLAGSRPRQRASAGQKTPQHSAGNARHEGRKTIPGNGQSRRRRPVHANHSDLRKHRRFRHERPTGHRSAPLVDPKLSGLTFPTHNVSRRDERGKPRAGICSRRTGPAWP